jgi:hypothetical protein
VNWLSAIEHSALSTWVREDTSIFAYPGILFLHTAGLSVVVGLCAVVDLRLLGFARRLPVAPLERFFPIIWAAFVVDAISGTILMAADATTRLTSPIFYVKMTLIAGAAAATVALRRTAFRRRAPDGSIPPAAKWLAAVSLALWFGATAAGRLMAYLGTVAGAPGLANRIG